MVVRFLDFQAGQQALKEIGRVTDRKKSALGGVIGKKELVLAQPHVHHPPRRGLEAYLLKSLAGQQALKEIGRLAGKKKLALVQLHVHFLVRRGFAACFLDYLAGQQVVKEVG